MYFHILLHSHVKYTSRYYLDRFSSNGLYAHQSGAISLTPSQTIFQERGCSNLTGTDGHFHNFCEGSLANLKLKTGLAGTYVFTTSFEIGVCRRPHHSNFDYI